MRQAFLLTWSVPRHSCCRSPMVIAGSSWGAAVAAPDSNTAHKVANRAMGFMVVSGWGTGGRHSTGPRTFAGCDRGSGLAQQQCHRLPVVHAPAVRQTRTLSRREAAVIELEVAPGARDCEREGHNRVVSGAPAAG